MKTLNAYLRETFGCKVYKIALNGGFTCPNRDGTLGDRGCIFCSAGGSGEFAGSIGSSIYDQIEQGKKLLHKKVGAVPCKYIAYFQAYTGTYAPVEKLERLYMEAVKHPDVVVISIATRPDCLDDDVLELLERINRIKPVWIELGLQTIHPGTSEYIRRGYSLDVYDRAVERLAAAGIDIITHVILGLPGETPEDMAETVRYVCKGHISGIKLQLLHILRGTDLADEYLAGKVQVLSEDDYISILKKCIRVIPDNVIVHRLTGDGDKRLLIAPMWSADKKHVLNRINKEVIPEFL